MCENLIITERYKSRGFVSFHFVFAVKSITDKNALYSMSLKVCHSKSAACVISIIIKALLCQSCTPKQIDLQAILLLQLPYSVNILLLTSGCKSAPAQYKCLYYLAPPQTLLRKQIRLN